jgi:cysteine desulfurase family protein (TIGR01976 family)
LGEEGLVSLDLEWIRSQFPALAQTDNGYPVTFLDGPGGTQVPASVVNAIATYLTTSNANAHGAFTSSIQTDRIIHAARSAIADLLNCTSEEVVFGANMTTLTFALSRALGRTIQPGDEIVVTQLDHDANVAPWMALQEQGAVIRVVQIKTEDCTIDWADFQRQLSDRTKLVAIGYASNAVGTINPVAAMIKLAHDVGALAFVDAVHYAPHGWMDVKALDCDFLACSVYKFFGPHVGILYGKHHHLERLQPYKLRPAPDQIPYRWETGTQNHEGLAGVVETIDYLAKVGRSLAPGVRTRRAALELALTEIQHYERGLSEELIPNLLKVPGLKLYGITEPNRFMERTPTVALRIVGQTPEQVARGLSDRGIYTWHGNFYALNLTQRLELEQQGGFVRIGFVHYNTIEEVHRLVNTLHEIAMRTEAGVH